MDAEQSEQPITWSVGIKEIVETHAQSAYPRECCGILVGKSLTHGQLILQAIAAENVADAERQLDRYVINPLAILRTDHNAREAGLEIVGFYHSHPDHPAIPSATDSELAWPAYVYVIVSVDRHRVGETRAWRWPPEGLLPMACPMREEAS